MTYTNWNLVAEVTLPNGNRGAIAKADIPSGALLGVFQGELERLELRENRLVEAEKHINLVQIVRDGDYLFGFIRNERAGIGLINHSCKPNVRIENQIVVVAGRAISAGEHLTADYRRWDLVPEGVPCWCEPPMCML
ncbi:MAG: SET domain-containing protein-lysine N-methyltransferase [Aestuariivirga sp.]|uniref:SET domain-containing protein-lysine N-methyltransferase n=1 Tax=Aestuariivirga sp. TaxID=2650926 RepID=UPI0038CF6245